MVTPVLFPFLGFLVSVQFRQRHEIRGTRPTWRQRILLGLAVYAAFWFMLGCEIVSHSRGRGSEDRLTVLAVMAGIGLTPLAIFWALARLYDSAGTRTGSAPTTGERPMSATTTSQLARRWTAAELRALPPEQCDAILAAAAALAEDDYRHDRQLTDFEAFGEDDLHGHSSDAQPR